jgi:hypothetical protein
VACWAALGVALLLGTILRFSRVLGSDFPLNDGGLFYLMTKELQAAHYRLPAFTAYNGASLPFAYPPLSFYLAGAISDITGHALLDVMRLLPAVLSALTIPAFYLLSRVLLRSRIEAAVATVIFALLPRTFLWFVMGGGLARAPGFLLALLMLHQTYLMYTRGETRFVVTTALLGSLAVLTHAENAWFAVHSAVLLFLFYGRHRRGLAHSLLVVAAVALLTAPWWGTVLHHHGVAPFVAVLEGGSAEGSLYFLRTFRVTDEPHAELLAALGLFGAFLHVAARAWFLPTWLVWIFVVNTRNPATVAAVPLAMLAGAAVIRILLPGIRAAAAPAAAAPAAPAAPPPRLPVRLRAAFPAAVAAALLAYLVGYAFMGARVVAGSSAGGYVLSRAERDAMRWVAAHVPDTTTFLVLSGTPAWFGLDATGEWFPVLAARASVSTVQGYEWLPGGRFWHRASLHQAARACARESADCLDEWGRRNERPFSYVYLRKADCCGRLRESLHASPDYALVYDGPGATIFARRGAVTLLPSGTRSPQTTQHD